jgi:hypothetical protein
MAIRRQLRSRDSVGKTAVPKLASRPGMRAGVTEDPRGMSRRAARSAPAMRCDLTGMVSGRRKRTRPTDRRRGQFRSSAPTPRGGENASTSQSGQEPIVVRKRAHPTLPRSTRGCMPGVVSAHHDGIRAKIESMISGTKWSQTEAGSIGTGTPTPAVADDLE